MMRSPLPTLLPLLAAALLGACSGLGESGRGGNGLAAAGGITPAPVPQRAQARYQAGREAMQAGQLEQALEHMTSLAQDYPWLSGPPLDAALICQRLQRPQQAERWYGLALQSRGDNLDAHNAYAVFLREQGRFHDARAQYLAALAVSEAHSTTHYNLGILYDLYLGDKKQALQHYARYRELSEADERQVAGWMADLQRQLDALAAAGGAL